MTPPATMYEIDKAVRKHINAGLPIKSPASIEWAVIEIINPTPEAEPQEDYFAAYARENGVNIGN